MNDDLQVTQHTLLEGASDIEERQYELKHPTSDTPQTKTHYMWKPEQKRWYSVILWKLNIIGHRRVTEIKSRGLEKNPVFLITQLCWLHQVKTKKNEPPFCPHQSHFPPNRFSSIVQQFSLGIKEHEDRRFSFESSETAWTLRWKECTEMLCSF